jgi:hypothetical protein
MVPIHQILQEMKLVFGTNDIAIPKTANDFPSRSMREKPNREPPAGPYKHETDAIRPSPSTKSGQKTDAIGGTAIHADGSLSQKYLPNPVYFADDAPPYPYRAILNKIKEESRESSTTVLTSTSTTAVECIDEVPTFPYTAPYIRFSTVPVPRSHNESNTKIFRNIMQQKRQKGSQHPGPYTEYNEITGPARLKFSDLRNNRHVQKRGGWRRMWLLVVLVFLMIIGLVLGLVFGLKAKHRKG